MRRSTPSILCLVTILVSGLSAPLAVADEVTPASATVSFGQWQTDPTLDRFPNQSPREGNDHQLIPHNVTITAGEMVNFIISGFHQPVAYADGTQPEDIDVEATTTTTGPTTSPAVVRIDDPTNRLYLGPDPSLQPLDRSGAAFIQDRVESVQFPQAGTYQAICGIRGHFATDGMYGFVTVLPNE